MARPKNFYSMYVSMMRIKVQDELENRPDIVDRLGRFKHKFINWCAKQRTIYEADIDDELSEFIEKFVNKRLYNTNVKFWKEITKKVFIRDNFTCQYCGQVGGILEVDHKIPISKGGDNSYDNLTTACRKCNRRKKDRTAETFLKTEVLLK